MTEGKGGDSLSLQLLLVALSLPQRHLVQAPGRYTREDDGVKLVVVVGDVEAPWADRESRWMRLSGYID